VYRPLSESVQTDDLGRMHLLRTGIASLTFWALGTAMTGGCGGDDSPSGAGGAAGQAASAGAAGAGQAGSGPSAGAAGAGQAGAGGGGPECSAKVKVGLYADDQCTDGSEVLIFTLDTALTCSGWTRPKGASTEDNAASRFRCYRDRLCYTQYRSTLECTTPQKTDKESRTTCTKDDTPNIWTKILGGTEPCPEAPAGFECPRSAPNQGTEGLVAACGE
jgi:hypothetical protein